MFVQVKLFSRFREYLPLEARGEAAVELPTGATVGQLLDHLGIAGPVKLIDVNDQQETDRGRTLSDGDRVRIFPMVVGG